jgi:uncharacterized protein (DUF2141 family)
MFFLLIAPGAVEAQLVVVVDGLKNTNGSVMVGLFDNEKDFLKKAVMGKVAPIEGERVTIVLSDVKPGKYAISIIHDANGNGKLDTNGLGIPKEGFGFGNNAMGVFGPPSFSKASVTIGQERVKQTLRMKYF